MTTERANRLLPAQNLAVSLAAVLAVVTGGMVLAGWAFDIAALKSILPGWVSMKPNAALAFILTGIALLFSARPPATLNPQLSSFFSRLARIFGVLAGLIGLATLAEYAFDWNPGIDQWLFPEPAGTVSTSNPGRVSPETALCFVLLAAGLEIARGPRKTMRASFASVILGSLVTTLALAALLTHFTPALGAYGWWGRTFMAVPTATLFVVLGAAMALVAWQENVLIWSLGGWVTAAFACGLALLVIIGLTTIRSQVRLHESINKLAHSEKVLNGVAQLSDDVANAQTHARGFVITGDERFLDAYVSAEGRSNNALGALRQLIARSPHRQPEFARLEAQTTEALQWFHQQSETRRTGAAVPPDIIRRGEDLMKPLRTLVDRMENNEERFLEQTKREWESVSRFTDTVIVTGTIVGLIIFLTAILALNHTTAERIRAEGTLREEDERFRLVAESASDVIYEWDIGTRVKWFGKVDELMGYGPGEFPRTLEGWADLLHPEDRGRVMAAVERQLSGEAAFDIEYRIRKRDDAYGTWWARGTVLRKADGKPYRWVGSITDITKRKLAEEEIHRLNTDLERRVMERTAELTAVNKELDSFAYSVSHDLRAPLRSVDGFAKVIEEDYAARLDEEGRDALRRVRGAAQRMGELIDDLLKLSRLGRSDMNVETVDLSELAGSVAGELKGREPGRSVVFEIAPKLEVRGDRRLLAVLLENLLGNAWKFTGKHAVAHIELGVTEDNGEPAYFVRDDGAGFELAHATNLFAPFQRLHSVSEFPGTGIGLATVRRIVQRHGGRVWAEGAIDKGATFYFTLTA